MPLDPDAQLVIDMIRAAGRPPFEELTPAEAREAYANSRRILQPPAQDVAESRDTSCSGPHGAIPLRLYRPAGSGAADVLPALVYYHGGGWLLGDLNSHDVACRRFTNSRLPWMIARRPHAGRSSRPPNWGSTRPAWRSGAIRPAATWPR